MIELGKSLCRVSDRVNSAKTLGKVRFAWRVRVEYPLAECNTRQRRHQVHMGLSRVFWVLGKVNFSSSVGNNVKPVLSFNKANNA